GHGNFVVIVTARSSLGRVSVLAVLADRKKETVKQFLQEIPARLKKRIESVCTDMYDGFINAAKEEIPSAVVVADRFHVARKYRECADNLREERDPPAQERDVARGIRGDQRRRCGPSGRGHKI
ncbi:MAG: transposase, partial [Pyrinomonadaceae bacterium]